MSFSLDQSVKAAGLTPADDVSACLPADAADVVIEGGPYRLNAEALTCLTACRVSGGGSVIWTDHRTMNSKQNPDPFDGIIPVARLNDPLFLSMNMPSELDTYMHWRVNGENMYLPGDDFDRVLPIGAVYRNEQNKPDNDLPITLCVKDLRLLLKTKDEDWHVGFERAVPTPNMVNSIYYLPWIGGSQRLPADRVTELEDHTEIWLTGGDLNAATVEGREAAVLHFWGGFTNVPGSTVLGLVTAFTIWIKEAEAVGTVGVAIGADWYTPERKIEQAYSGRNWLLTTEPRVVMGHTVGPKAYDAVMDVAKVKQLLGLK